MVRQPSNADADGVQELTLESVLTPTDYPFIEAIAGVNTDDPRAKQRLLAVIADDAYPRIHKALCCFGRSPTYLDSSFTTPLRIMYINKVADRATVASRAAWEAEDRTAAEEAAREAGRVAAEIDEIVEGLKATGVRDQAWTSAQSAQAAAHNAVLAANGSVQEYDSLVPQVSRGTNTDADLLEPGMKQTYILLTTSKHVLRRFQNSGQTCSFLAWIDAEGCRIAWSGRFDGFAVVESPAIQHR